MSKLRCMFSSPENYRLLLVLYQAALLRCGNLPGGMDDEGDCLMVRWHPATEATGGLRQQKHINTRTRVELLYPHKMCSE